MAAPVQREKRPPKDVHAGDRNLLFNRIAMAAVGAAVGMAWGWVATENVAASLVAAVPGALVSWYALELIGAVAGRLYFGSGRSTPYRHQHSMALALVAQGKYLAAIAEFERDIAEDRRTSAPYLHIARIHRDKLGQPEDAIAWFKRARTAGVLGPGEEMMVAREMYEIFTLRLKSPVRAVPELARIAETYPGTDGDWARKELAELRRHVAGQHSADSA